jgi:hypothetical protein
MGHLLVMLTKHKKNPVRDRVNWEYGPQAYEK